MTTPAPKSKSALGFLTVVADPQHGLFGGYLVLNLAGRPLEFHCTAPIKPNRAQEILFGPTLEPYLYGEQIGQTLLAKAQIEPLAVCTDLMAALAVREYASVPVALVLTTGYPPGDTGCLGGPDVAPGEDETIWRLDGPHARGPRLALLRIGRNHLAVAAAPCADRQTITDRLSILDESFDLAEPFSRIREAIEEARRGG